jgi:hypothetical protein
MKWRKGGKKGIKKGGKRESQTGVFTVALFCTLLFSFPPELHCLIFATHGVFFDASALIHVVAHQ